MPVWQKTFLFSRCRSSKSKLFCHYWNFRTKNLIKFLKMSSNRGNAKKYKWALDFTARRGTNQDSLSPPGFNPAVSQAHIETSKDNDPSHLIIKKSWDLALAPLKQVPMNLFIMYMAGNSISPFPIMMVGMLLIRPIKALFTLQSTFKMIEGNHAIMQKFVYFLGNIAGMLLALYKCQSMGLLPSHSSDWLAFIDPPVRLEYLGGGMSLY